MSMFYLEPSGFISNIFCPNCNSGYDIEWYTEYGEPIDGAHKVSCPNCRHKFTMRVSTQTFYAVEDTED